MTPKYEEASFFRAKQSRIENADTKFLPPVVEEYKLKI